MSESKQFQAFINTRNGLEELDFFDGPLPQLIISALRSEIGLMRSIPPDSVRYTITPYRMVGGSLHIAGSESGFADSSEPTVNVSFVVNTPIGGLPRLCPIDALEERYYESPDVAQEDVDELAYEAVLRSAKLN